MMQRPHEELHLSPPEGEALIERLERNTLSAEDRYVLVQVVRWVFWLFFVVQEAKLSLKRLRVLVFGEPSTAPQAEGTAGGIGAGEDAGQPGAEPAEGPGTPEPPAAPRHAMVQSQVDAGGERACRGGHRLGQGRLGAATYAGAERVACRHETLRVGEVCPVCGRGRL